MHRPLLRANYQAKSSRHVSASCRSSTASAGKLKLVLRLEAPLPDLFDSVGLPVLENDVLLDPVSLVSGTEPVGELGFASTGELTDDGREPEAVRSRSARSRLGMSVARR